MRIKHLQVPVKTSSPASVKIAQLSHIQGLGFVYIGDLLLISCRSNMKQGLELVYIGDLLLMSYSAKPGLGLVYMRLFVISYSTKQDFVPPHP